MISGVAIKRRIRDRIRMFKAAITVVVLELAIFGAILSYRGEHPFFTYDATAASMLLTASGVILTGTAVVIAVMAVIGYTNIRDLAIKAATDAAVKQAEEVARAVATRTVREAGESETTPEQGDQVADSYSKGE